MFRTDLPEILMTDSRNLGQRGQEPHPLQQLHPPTSRLGHIREYTPGRALPLQSR